MSEESRDISSEIAFPGPPSRLLRHSWSVAVGHLFSIIPTPIGVFKSFEKEIYPSVYLTLILVASACVDWFMIAPQLILVSKIYTSSFGEAAAASAMISVSKTFMVIGLLVKPFMLCLKFLFYSLAVQLSSTLISAEKKFSFKQVFGTVVICEVIFLAGNFFTMLILYAKGLDSLQGASDLVVFKGLDALVQSTNTAVSDMFREISPVSCWYFAILSLGIREAIGVKLYQAILIVTASSLAWFEIGFLQPLLVGWIMGS